jgi:HSP20 family protein
MTRYTPGRTVSDLQREVDRIFDSFFSSGSPDGSRSAAWAPSMDLVETDTDFRLHLDVPGMTKEDLNISLQNNTLTVSGTRRDKSTDTDGNYVRVERSFGDFYRSFTLPKSVNPDEIEAAYDNGVLSIHIPKTEESKSRQIEIN